jgi:hypothetical protein
LTVCAQPSLRKSFAPERAQYDFFPPILAEIFCAGGTKERWRFDSVDARAHPQPLSLAVA